MLLEGQSWTSFCDATFSVFFLNFLRFKHNLANGTSFPHQLTQGGLERAVRPYWHVHYRFRPFSSCNWPFLYYGRIIRLDEQLGKHLPFVWLCVSSIKTDTRRIMRLDELSLVVRRSRRISKDIVCLDG